MLMEINKLLKSRIILFMLIIMIILSFSFSILALQGISSGLSVNDKLMIGDEINYELIYYCVPLLVTFLADFIFNRDIVLGTMKHLILKSDRRKIYIYKVISLSLAAVLLNILFNLMNAVLINYKLEIGITLKFLKSALYESIPIIEMSSVFALVSIISKKNNIIYLISIHFLVLYLTETALLIGQYTYLTDFKTAILDRSLSFFSPIKVIVLILINYLIFRNRELTE